MCARLETPQAAGTDILGKWKYAPGHDVFIGINSAVSGDVRVFKPTNWQPTAIPDGGSEAPDVAITSPTTYSLPVDGEVLVTVDASDDTEVRLYAGGELVDFDTTAPYRMTFHASVFNEGFATIRAEAEDFAGNARFSSGVRLQVVGKEPGEVVVDERDSNILRRGFWQNGYMPVPYAGASLRGDPTARFSWYPRVPAAGGYDVYAWWTPASTRGTTVLYTIDHTGGSSVVRIDQRANNTSQWNYLGTYDLPVGPATISIAGAGGTVSADAVRLVPTDSAPRVEVIVDNTSGNVTRTGAWPVSSGANPYRANSWYSNSGSTRTWRPSLPERGRHKVYARWTWHPNRTGAARCRTISIRTPASLR